ncbi:MAG: hypothetical protein ACOYNL_10955 [Rickettsiales bacterium]
MIAQGIALSAKQAFLFGMHQPTDTYKIALYTKRANIGPATERYTDEGEVSGQGYTRGGITLTGYKVTTVGKNAAITFADVKIDRATFTAHGAIVYNASKNNSVLCTLNFGNDRPVFDGAFEIRFPQPNENSALILFA